MGISEKKLATVKGKLNKKALIEKDYTKHHNKLFEYATILKNSTIKNIIINAEDIIFTIREKNIKIAVPNLEVNSIPPQFLNFDANYSNELSLLKFLLKNEKIVFDIGANNGWYSIVFAKNFLKKKIYGFEAFPYTFHLLKKNILLNNCKNIIFKNLNFSYQNKKIKYYLEDFEGISTSNIQKSSYNIKEIYITDTTLDTYCKKSKVLPDFIKCNVYGSELSIFFGGKKTIKKNNPIIYLEMLNYVSNKLVYKPEYIFKFFCDLGYAIFKNDDGILKPFINNLHKIKFAKFCFLHKKKHLNLIKKLSYNR